MNLLIIVKRDAAQDEFCRDAVDAGVEIFPVVGLSRIFRTSGYTLDDFPLKDHPAVMSVENGDTPVKGASSNSFTIANDLSGGNWALARLVRRDAPWNVDRIKTPFDSYFRSVRDGTGVDIYILDSGVRTTHNEFSGRATNVYEFYSSGGAGDDEGHGTSCASLACGETVGVARGALLWSFKVLDDTNAGSSLATATGIGEIIDHYEGRSATNRPAVCSVSILFTSDILEGAFEDLVNAGIVVVAAAGNTMADLAVDPIYPAAHPNIICAGGLMMNDTPYFQGGGFGTNYGSEVDVLAGAQLIYVATLTNDTAFRRFNGTSASCPLVAGVVACMLQGKSRLTTLTQVQAVRTKLLANATTGRFRAQSQFGIGTLPDRILYLDPDVSSETIDGVS